jgi:hypothetical protein
MPCVSLKLDSVSGIDINIAGEVERRPVEGGLTGGLVRLPCAPVRDASTHAGPHNQLVAPVPVLSVRVRHEWSPQDLYVITEEGQLTSGYLLKLQLKAVVVAW